MDGEYMLPDGFVYLDDMLNNVYIDARYAGARNFTGRPVDGYNVNRAVGACALAQALNAALEEVARMGLTLLIYDAYRPQRAVNAFALWAEAPEDGRTKSEYYPNIDKRALFGMGYIAKKSSHSRGGAVDLTLCSTRAEPLDMGGGFDLMDARSSHGFGDLTRAQANNRRLLRRVMLNAGFLDYEKEWWHYNIAREPYPDMYFDFVIE